MYTTPTHTLPLPPITATAAAAQPRRATAAPPRRSPTATLYEILRVKRTASQREIKDAYRRLAKKHHPDMMIDDGERSDGGDFISIHKAYETLSDPSSRQVYDLSLMMMVGRGGLQRPVGDVITRRWETDQCW